MGVLVGRAPRRAHAQIHRHAQDRTVGGAGDPGHQVVHQVLRYAVMSKLIAAIPPSISSSPVRTPSATRRSRPNRWRRWRTLPPTATRSCASWSTRLPTPAYLLLCHMGIGCPMTPDPTAQFRSIPGHWRPIDDDALAVAPAEVLQEISGRRCRIRFGGSPGTVKPPTPAGPESTVLWSAPPQDGLHALRCGSCNDLMVSKREVPINSGFRRGASNRGPPNCTYILVGDRPSFRCGSDCGTNPFVRSGRINRTTSRR